MALRYTFTNSELSRPRARAPTAFVAGVAAFMAFGPAAGAGAASTEADADCDGIVNASDQCPTEAEDRDNHADEDGCPDPDNDGDVIADSADMCPDEAEAVNDFEDGDGCPDAAIEIKKDRIELKQRIHFAFDRSEILPRSYPMLEEIARAIAEHPELGVVRIEGHTDDLGSRSYNQELSEQRAVAVHDHLIGLRTAQARLVHVGRGETQHRVAGTSEDARAQNRRVEFVVEFGLADAPRDVSVREAAIARASLKPRQSYAGMTALITGCVPMSVSASEAALEEADIEVAAPAEQTMQRSTLLPLALSLSVGGGVTTFADEQMRDVAGLAGSWEARLTLGTRQWISVEAAYMGSAQEVDSLGLDTTAVLVSNGFGAALRLNLFTDRYQPYLLAGAAYRQYDVMNSDFNTSSVADEDEVLETPLGVGFNYRYARLILDARAVYRRVFDNDLIQPFEGQDAPALHTWSANLMAGFEF
jgi:outer membrane protein OmpA-like peptidoglycan-associated protein